MSSPAARSRPSRRLLAVLAGCGLLVVCALIAGAVSGGLLYLRGRGPAPAGPPSVEYVLDASPRMSQAADGGTRLSVAQGVLAEIVRPADTTVTAGLRVFGTGQVPAACQDTDLLVPLAPANQAQISDRLTTLQGGAGSDSALGAAMVAAIRDLAGIGGTHSLVVVTGGGDSCNAQAGQLIAQEAKRAGIKLQLFVVGFEVSTTDGVGVQGLVDQTSGGVYVAAGSAADLQRTLAAIQTYVEKPATTNIANVVATAGAVTPPGTAPAGPTATALNTGLLQLTVLGYAGQPAPSDGRLTVEAFNPQDHDTVLDTERANPAPLRLPAGSYDVRMTYAAAERSPNAGGDTQQWLTGVLISAGQTTKVSYDLKLGEVNLTVLEAAGIPVTPDQYGFGFQIFHPDDPLNFVAWVIVSNTATLQLPPGVYFLKADYPNTTLATQDQTAQTFEVKTGQSLAYTFDLKLGHLLVEVDDDSGQPIDGSRLAAIAYPAGQHPDAFFAFTNGANPADLALHGGTGYDLRLRLDGNQQLTLTNQQVREAERQTIKVNARDFK